MGIWKTVGLAALYAADTVGTVAVEGVIGVAKTASKVYGEYQKPEKDRKIADCILEGALKTAETACTSGARKLSEGTVAVIEDYKKQEAQWAEERKAKEEQEKYHQLENRAIRRYYGNHSYSFTVKVAGVSKENRWQLVDKLGENQTILAVREKDNAYDRNAIALYAGLNKIGFIPRDTTAKIAPKVDDGKRMAVKIKSISGVGSTYPDVMVEINMESDYQKPKFQNRQENEYDDYDDYDWGAEPDYHEVEVDDDIRDEQIRREEGWDY